MVINMKAFTVSKDSVVKELNSDLQAGLSESQVAENAAKYGLNSLERDKPVSLTARIIGALKEPMLIMLMLAALVALGVNIALYVTGGHADFLECAGIFAAIAICVGISVTMEGKSAKAFEALAKINEDIVVKVIRGGKPALISQKEVVAGDIVTIQTGDRIPADGRVLESLSLQSDESSLTGESKAVKKDADCVLNDEKTPVAERVNMLYSGSFVTNGSGRMIVTEVGGNTEFGKIAAELSAGAAENKSTPLQEKLAKMGKIIAVFGVTAAALAFVAQLVMFITSGTAELANIADAFITSVVLVVAAVPEGLPTIVAVSLAISVIKMSKQNALVKKMVACETVGCIDVICSDKTGTLTENKMTVINDITSQAIIKNIAVNSTADIDSSGVFIGNPTECALLVKAGDYKSVRADADIISVVPFSSEEKSMTTVVKDERGETTYIKGSPEKILSLCNLQAERHGKFSAEIISYQKKACRIIAFAHSINGGDFHYDGFAAITDPLRHDVFEAVNNCRSAGIALKILTGDNIVTARAIADELKLLDKNSIAAEAKDLEHLSDDELLEMLPKIRIIARSTPVIKMRVVKLLKSQSHVFAVPGEGINDAPAIKNADVGIAMGITGTEVSKEAADIVLLDDSFATIAKAVKWGRGIYENFQRFIVFQLTVNVSSVMVVLTSILAGLGAPFTALQLLWINIIMDGPPAIALGLEPIRGDLMKRAPTKRDAPIVSGAMISRIVFMGGIMFILFMAQSLFNFLGAEEASKQTALFNLFAVFQLFNAFNSRELGRTSIFKNFAANKLIFWSIGAAFIMQFLIVQFGGAFFRTVPLPADMWLKTIGIGIILVLISELIRFLRG
ncbi:MAG: calcium-translocating P-type ATPase, PMCA-type [Oscillospiraceae bacterium]|nr:calcium-translocating P-type ATPase, PMCA-type [Oscillospiraceae bacterium]